MDRPQILRQMIADYRKRIERYEAMISEWENELGLSAGASENLQEEKADKLAPKTGKSTGSVISSIREWQFFNKSQPEATKSLLETAGHPMKTEDIIACLEKGGIKFNSKDDKTKKATFYTILKRQDDFATIAPNTWALTSWPGVKRKVSDADNDQEDTKAVNQDA